MAFYGLVLISRGSYTDHCAGFGPTAAGFPLGLLKQIVVATIFLRGVEECRGFVGAQSPMFPEIS